MIQRKWGSRTICKWQKWWRWTKMSVAGSSPGLQDEEVTGRLSTPPQTQCTAPGGSLELQIKLLAGWLCCRDLLLPWTMYCNNMYMNAQVHAHVHVCAHCHLHCCRPGTEPHSLGSTILLFFLNGSVVVYNVVLQRRNETNKNISFQHRAKWFRFMCVCSFWDSLSL